MVASGGGTVNIGVGLRAAWGVPGEVPCANGRPVGPYHVGREHSSHARPPFPGAGRDLRDGSQRVGAPGEAMGLGSADRS